MLGRGLPTALPAIAGEGFAVMSGFFIWSRLQTGQVVVLPDKEFRYLRTVIVTAAVYRGLTSELRLTANPSA